MLIMLARMKYVLGLLTICLLTNSCKKDEIVTDEELWDIDGTWVSKSSDGTRYIFADNNHFAYYAIPQSKPEYFYEFSFGGYNMDSHTLEFILDGYDNQLKRAQEYNHTQNQKVIYNWSFSDYYYCYGTPLYIPDELELPLPRFQLTRHSKDSFSINGVKYDRRNSNPKASVEGIWRGWGMNHETIMDNHVQRSKPLQPFSFSVSISCTSDGTPHSLSISGLVDKEGNKIEDLICNNIEVESRLFHYPIMWRILSNNTTKEYSYDITISFLQGEEIAEYYLLVDYLNNERKSGIGLVHGLIYR